LEVHASERRVTGTGANLAEPELTAVKLLPAPGRASSLQPVDGQIKIVTPYG
jgi:hypothetical protein